MSISKKQVDEVVIRFAGDSGDGMQLTGGRFTETTAIVGNDLSTLPDFPAEILGSFEVLLDFGIFYCFIMADFWFINLCTKSANISTTNVPH